MRPQTMKRKLPPLLLLAVLCIAALHVRAQNQTPANVGPVVGWSDPATGLNWTSEDNGSDVNWNQANAYCSNLRLGGYSDWRLPTIDELQGIYDERSSIHVKGNLILSTNWQWSSSQASASGGAWYFAFNVGKRGSSPFRDGGYLRALCVRR